MRRILKLFVYLSCILLHIFLIFCRLITHEDVKLFITHQNLLKVTFKNRMWLFYKLLQFRMTCESTHIK